jgi:hypothetical protein
MTPRDTKTHPRWIRRGAFLLLTLAALQSVACACASCPAKHAPELRSARR